MILYPHQADLVERVRAAFRDHRSVLMQGGTGLGKTACSSDIVRRAVERGKRVVFVTHLTEIIDDTSDRLTAVGIEHGLVQADRPTNPTAPVQIASIATLHRRGERPPADLIIADECHRTPGASWIEVLAAYPDARLLGLSATPARADDAPLTAFDVMVCGPSIQWLTENGYLVQCVVLSPPEPMDGGLALDPAEAYQRHAPGSRALVFCTTVEQAQDVARRMPVETQLVVGDTPREVRRAVRQRVTEGSLRVLVACSAPLEGFDLPALETIILARALSTTTSYLQAVGRGMRPSPATGKRECTVLDLTGAAIMHGLPADRREWSLVGSAAVRRTGEGLIALCRCRSCYAIFPSGPASCVRCGAPTAGTRLPRRASRTERLELQRLDTRPQHERDAMALAGIRKKLLASGRFPLHRVDSIARSIFEKSKKRSPPATAPEAA